ncbi:hypothetical protein SAMN04487996_111329 [Dyadobacter soli]|uniref:Uncharacterized protein n=1 Tax=Dyadobacter soli TaxID=659014 RepID=A0A1G7MNA5_9BACT|nr:hypothetical protein SAMN04487996_111329 [Dyadobacter soli]
MNTKPDSNSEQIYITTNPFVSKQETTTERKEGKRRRISKPVYSVRFG